MPIETHQKTGGVNAFPLSIAPLGTPLTILPALTTTLGRHLLDLGLTPNEEITVLENSGSGVVIHVRGVRLAIDMKTARTIRVRF